MSANAGVGQSGCPPDCDSGSRKGIGVQKLFGLGRELETPRAGALFNGKRIK